MNLLDQFVRPCMCVHCGVVEELDSFDCLGCEPFTVVCNSCGKETPLPKLGEYMAEHKDAKPREKPIDVKAGNEVYCKHTNTHALVLRVWMSTMTIDGTPQPPHPMMHVRFTDNQEMYYSLHSPWWEPLPKGRTPKFADGKLITPTVIQVEAPATPAKTEDWGDI